MVRALASHQCAPGLIPGPGIIHVCGLSLLLALYTAPGFPLSSKTNNWRPFYEAQFGVEIFVELYNLRFHHQSPPKCCKDTLPFYFINFSVVVYCYYGYLPIS